MGEPLASRLDALDQERQAGAADERAAK